jgi:hypothetical protein
MGKEEKVMKIIHRAATALLQIFTALARIAFFLAALSPREFRRATEAGSLQIRLEEKTSRSK